jgi:hypothetical protein
MANPLAHQLKRIIDSSLNFLETHNMKYLLPRVLSLLIIGFIVSATLPPGAVTASEMSKPGI